MSMMECVEDTSVNSADKDQIFHAIKGVFDWLEKNDYRAYDTFDGLSAKYLRPLTLESNLLRIVLQQGVRRFPVNLRPLLGIPRSRSTKGMGFLARGFLRLHETTGNSVWQKKAEFALDWLVDNQSRGYSGACWGNHFDYQSRSCFVTKDSPSIVWTAHIGHAFLDAYEHLRKPEYLQVAVSSCEHILRDLGPFPKGDTVYINYFPTTTHAVHNASMLGASLLARTYSHTSNESYRDIAERAVRYTAKHQHPDGSWYYGEPDNLRWVDNFHTAYVLDCFKVYSESTNDHSFDAGMMAGYDYWKKTFFLPDGTPKYYNHKTLPLDIQCSSQAIDTLAFFSNVDSEALPLAMNVARWTIENMRDPSGYFYYRRYSRWLVNKTPTMHWGQATMLCGLAGLYRALSQRDRT